MMYVGAICREGRRSSHQAANGDERHVEKRQGHQVKRGYRLEVFCAAHPLGGDRENQRDDDKAQEFAPGVAEE